MASKKDVAQETSWHTLANTRDPSVLPAVLERLEEGAPTKLEARFGALLTWPKRAEIASATAQVIRRFPWRFREQLTCANAALGCLVLHGATSSKLQPLEKVDAPNDVMQAWRDDVVKAFTALEQPQPLGDGRTDGALPTAPKALHQAWLERASKRRRGDLADLLAHLGDGAGTHIVERLLLLATFPASSDIGDAVAKLVTDAPVRFNSPTPLFALVALLLTVHGNASHRATALRLGSEIPSLAWLELALPTGPSARRAAPRVSSPSSEDDFLEWLAQAPGELGRRHAFADWLLERSHPRGEFMALQLAALERPLSTKEERRVGALVKRHQKAWLTSFKKAVTAHGTEFEGGVLARLRLEVAASGGKAVDPSTPQLATVTTLEVLGVEPESVGKLLNSPRLRAVKSLTVDAPALPLIPQALLDQVQALGVKVRWAPESWSAAGASAFLDAARLPKVQTIGLLGSVRGESAALIAKSQWARRVSTLRLQSLTPEAFWPILPALGPKVLEVLPEDGHGAPDLRWRFERSDSGWSLTIEGAIPKEDGAITRFLLGPLDRLDEAIRKTLRFRPGGVVSKGVRTALEKRGVELNAVDGRDEAEGSLMSEAPARAS